MLKQRIITALLLLLAILPAMFAPQFEFFAAFALLAVTVAMWEWARLLRFGFWGAAVCAAILGLVCVSIWDRGFNAHMVQSLLSAAIAVWAVIILLTLPQAKFPVFLLNGVGRYGHVLFAIVALTAGWCVLVLAQQRGGFFVFSMLALVAAADVFAYFAGKAYGRHKLAPSISPGKTREGALGGLAGALVLALAFSAWSLTYFYALGHGALLKIALLALLFAAVSIAGDLFESLLKRQAGAKDSGTLLPGHGGVLDRIDAMIPVLPLMWMML